VRAPEQVTGQGNLVGVAMNLRRKNNIQAGSVGARVLDVAAGDCHGARSPLSLSECLQLPLAAITGRDAARRPSLTACQSRISARLRRTVRRLAIHGARPYGNKLQRTIAQRAITASFGPIFLPSE
jgi:hypothetical protein